MRLPGYDPGSSGSSGDGRNPPARPIESEVAKLNPIDKLPPITVITGFHKDGSQRLVRGTTSDNGVLAKVLVNGKEARILPGTFGQWEITLDGIDAGLVELTAHAEDQVGNVELTKHSVTVVVR